MITKVADFLEALKQKEQEVLQKYSDIGHAPTIGAMYEGLTKEILNRSIFRGMDIRIVSGKIINSEGVYSNQIDCMIVEGEGEKIPYTEEYIYNISKVIAVIEVKKNLYSAELQSAYSNLRSVVNIHESKAVNRRIVRDAYRNFTNHEVPEQNELKEMPIGDQMIYHLLVEEANLPIRIVFGYNGFASEYSLRKSFYEYLEENLTTDLDDIKYGFGVRSFPNLIICNKLSLIKLNGMPFVLKVQYEDGRNESDFHHIYGSYSQNPLLLLLELIWTRLSYQYELGAGIFGEDLKEEITHPFLECRITEKKGGIGWEYKYNDLDQNFLDSLGNEKEWEPCIIDDEQGILITILCSEGKISINDPFIDELVNNETKEDFIKRLKSTYLVDVDKEENFYLLTDECQLIMLPDGRSVAAENSTGRLTRWVEKYMRKFNHKTV